MDRSNRRRTLGIVAIVVGALASAGTSASPGPTPALSSSHQGTLTVTADEPVAWVDVAANEDANLIAAEGQTAVRMDARTLDSGVFLIAEELGAPDNSYTGLGSVNRTANCPVGAPCASTIRLIAILVDPVGHPSVEVQYTGTAETRFPSSSGPVPSAEIEVDVSDVTSMTADAVGMRKTEPEEIRLGPDTPRAVRSVHVSLPGGLPADATLGPNAVVMTTLLDKDPGYTPDFFVRSVTDDRAFDVPLYAPLLSPFAHCVAGEPCEADLELEFDWNGGPAEGVAIDWSLAVWPGLGAGEAAEAGAIDPPVPADVSWNDPLLTQSMSDQTDITRDGHANITLDASLDLSDVPQRVGDVRGLIRTTLQATPTSGTNPAAKVRLSFGGNDYEMPAPGETLTLYSRAQEVSCDGRSVCPLETPISFGFHRDSADAPQAIVDWTANVEFLLLESLEALDGAKLDVVIPPPP